MLDMDFVRLQRVWANQDVIGDGYITMVKELQLGDIDDVSEDRRALVGINGITFEL